MKILFVGDLNEYGRSFQRYRTLANLGHVIVAVPMFPRVPHADIASSFFEKVMWKLSLPLDRAGANRALRTLVTQETFDIVWIEKGNTILPSTLRFVKKKLPHAKLISLSEDDMYARHNRSLYYRWGLQHYDVIFTTKMYNLEELKRFGAKRTELFIDAYDETLHRPVVLTAEEQTIFGCDVGFIGTFETARARSLLCLAECGVTVAVWGNGWIEWSKKHSRLIVKNRPVYGENYVKAINATKINLCFLRKMNRDETTSRSVEIPACGGFMLAERTKRHAELFEDGEEAVFFGSDDELLMLIKKYLADDHERKRIAAAGRERCVWSGYSHKIQLERILKSIGAS